MAKAEKIIVVPGMCLGEFSIQVGYKASWANDLSDLQWQQEKYVERSQVAKAICKLLKRHKLVREAAISSDEAVRLHGFVFPE